MTVGKLIEILKDYSEDLHVVIAVRRYMSDPGKLEIVDAWSDSFDNLNILSGPPAGDIDPKMGEESGYPIRDDRSAK